VVGEEAPAPLSPPDLQQEGPAMTSQGGETKRMHRDPPPHTVEEGDARATASCSLCAVVGGERVPSWGGSVVGRRDMRERRGFFLTRHSLCERGLDVPHFKTGRLGGSRSMSMHGPDQGLVELRGCKVD
jgi:hypothetical protein